MKTGKYYLIGFNSEGYNPLGSSCAYISRKKSFKGQLKEAECMVNNTKNQEKVVEVYSFPASSYSQEVCEMDMDDFNEYVKIYGTRLI